MNNYVYEICGKTMDGKYVRFSYGSLKFVMDGFIKKYPRFKGTAKIFRCIAHEHEEIIMVDSNESTEINVFHSTNLLKDMLKLHLILEDLKK